jgi:hypothetical protein
VPGVRSRYRVSRGVHLVGRCHLLYRVVP